MFWEALDLSALGGHRRNAACRASRTYLYCFFQNDVYGCLAPDQIQYEYNDSTKHLLFKSVSLLAITRSTIHRYEHLDCILSLLTLSGIITFQHSNNAFYTTAVYSFHVLVYGFPPDGPALYHLSSPDML